MIDFLIGNIVRKQAQKSIDRLNPKVDVHIPKELPLPSVSVIKKHSVVVSQINALEEAISKLSDSDLKAKTSFFKKKYEEGFASKKSEYENLEDQYAKASSGAEREDLLIQVEKAKEELKALRKNILDGILPEAFAVVREVAQRTLGMRHYDVQMIGGIVIHSGQIAEMATGEGKTLVSTLPAYLNAITGEGVHIVTVNDYLARRDRQWMGPIYEFLGLTVGVILHDMGHEERQYAYHCDVTYGTNNEFGFDYLRDNMVNDKEEMVQRQHHFAIVDEVDSILIDEARTPLIISGPAETATDKYYKAYEASMRLSGRRVTEGEQVEAKYREEDLSIGYDYLADEKARSVSLTEAGEEKAAKLFGIDNLHDMETVEYRHHILQALKAKEFFRRDVDYVVKEGQVVIVDEFTGRMMPGRRWSDGLHQAVEAKERIKIERENQTLATITFQNYFRMYEKLAGMTGTAYTEVNEFEQIYTLDCVVMPTNRVLQRNNFSDLIYKTIKEKYKAVIEEIVDCHKRGQPVLVGTISIEKSELLSQMLKTRGVAHQVLNAKYHDLEAQIVAQAGRFKAVTIATNMAGRGTDIVLGGNAEFLARNLLHQKVQSGEVTEPDEELVKKFIDQFREQVKKEHALVVEAGGLHILGTERHESRRIDNQLRGRSGRQGDPGSSKFYVSLEDDLMRLFASDKISTLMDKFGMEEDQVIEHPWVTRALEVAQKRVETFNFEIRKQLLDFDNVMNKQREAIYSLRRQILESQSVRDLICSSMRDTAYDLVVRYLFTGDSQVKWDVEGLSLFLRSTYGLDLSPVKEKLNEMSQTEIEDFLFEGLIKIYEQKEREADIESFRHMEKMLFLHIIDAKWKDHLFAMDHLREGVGLRSYGQRDPLVEYKREGYQMFQMMYESIHQEIVDTVFRIQPAQGPRRIRSVFGSLPQEFVHNEFLGLDRPPASKTAPAPFPQEGPLERGAHKEQQKIQPIRQTGPKVGRNAPCPCGSGNKYKKCCGK